MTNEDFTNLKIVSSGRKLILDEVVADIVIRTICKLYGTPDGYDDIGGVKYQRYFIYDEIFHCKGIIEPGKPKCLLPKFPDANLNIEDIYLALVKLSYKYESRQFALLLNTMRGADVYSKYENIIKSYYRDIA